MTRLKIICLRFVFLLLSILPLSVLRSIGSVVGILAMKLSKRAGKRLRNNLLITKICDETNIDRIACQTSAELGKTLVESVAIAWHRSRLYSANLVLYTIGLDQIKQAAAEGAVVFLTPHIGNFEIAVKSAAAKISNKKFNILYKPTKNPVLNHIMLSGRTEDNINPVPTSRYGVATLLKAIKNKELVGMLPDSVASGGDGVWVEFFGLPVFATTLAAKFTMMPNVKSFVVSSKRVPGGFISEFIPYAPVSHNINIVVQELYKMFEHIVLENPTQYYWSYDRFRVPDKERHKFK